MATNNSSQFVPRFVGIREIPMLNFNEKDPKFFIGAVLIVIAAFIIAAQFALPDGFYGGTTILKGLKLF